MGVTPIKVLLIAVSSELGPVEWNLLNLVRYMDPGRIKPEVLALTGPGRLTLLTMQAGAESWNWALENPWRPVLWRRMQLFLRGGKYQAVHTFGPEAEFLAAGVAHGMNMPLIAQTAVGEPGPAGLRKMMLAGVAEGVSLRVVDTAAGMNGNGARAANRVLIEPGVTGIGAVAEDEKGKIRKRLKLVEGRNVELTVGRTVRVNGAEMAWKDVCFEIEDYLRVADRVRIEGDGLAARMTRLMARSVGCAVEGNGGGTGGGGESGAAGGGGALAEKNTIERAVGRTMDLYEAVATPAW